MEDLQALIYKSEGYKAEFFKINERINSFLANNELTENNLNLPDIATADNIFTPLFKYIKSLNKYGYMKLIFRNDAGLYFDNEMLEEFVSEVEVTNFNFETEVRCKIIDPFLTRYIFNSLISNEHNKTNI